MTPAEILATLCLAAWPAFGGPARPVAVHTDTSARVTATHETAASLLKLTDEELQSLIETDAASLGSLSIGTPGSARLFNGFQLPEGTLWEIARGAQTWATSETIDAIQIAVETVHQLFPDTQPITIGDISGPEGGRLKRHESHQGGRDADLGFYYKEGKGAWFTPGTAANLDLDRNWALLRALIVQTDVEKVLLDTKIQKLLYKHALAIGEDQAWLDRVFQFAKHSPEAIVRHVTGHRTHYHVRLYNPVAQELGRRAYPVLVQMQLMDPPVLNVRHVVRRGQTIGQLANRYGTSVRAIMQANGLRTQRLRAGRSYRIPVRAAAIPPSEPLVVPQRLLPPLTPPAMAAVDWPTAESLYPEAPTPSR